MKGVRVRSLTRSTRGGRGACWSSGIRTRKSDKLYLLIRTCIKPTNKLVSSLSRTTLVLGQPRATLDSQDSPRPDLGGSHHLPPYNIICASARHLHPNGLFIPGLPRRSPETVPVWTPATSWGHNFFSDLQLG
jgi:hypothetical protein